MSAQKTGWRSRIAQRVLPGPSRILDRWRRQTEFREISGELFHDARAFPSAPARESQSMVYKYVEEALLQGSAIDYLEFGVWEGVTIKTWMALNQNPESRFYGFDSFQGLPSDWTTRKRIGHFDVRGREPTMNDPRVQFIKGWFHETLPDFLKSFVARGRVVVHVDSDLYASALCVLTSLNHILESGSIIIFDEFCDTENEYAAWRDYALAYWRKARGICYTPDYVRVALLLV